MDTKDCRIELKAVSEDGTFEGYAAIYDAVDEAKDSIQRGAFKKTLNEGSRVLPLLWQHDQSQPIGRVELADSEKGLFARGKLLLSVPKAQEAYTLLKEGIVKGLSIGYRTIVDRFEGDVRRLKEIRLFEVSVVTLPCQPAALISAVKAQPATDAEAIDAFRNAANDLRDWRTRIIEGD